MAIYFLNNTKREAGKLMLICSVGGHSLIFLGLLALSELGEYVSGKTRERKKRQGL